MGGTEYRFYETLEPPYQAKDGPIDDLSELLLVRGVTPEIYWGGVATNHLPAAFQNKVGFQQPGGGVLAYDVGLVDLFTPLSSGQININTATARVLQMLPFVDENVAAEIIRLRSGPDGMDGTDDDTPLRSPGELVNAGLNNQVVGQIGRYCTVRSRTFEVQVDAEINGYHRYFYAILGRNGPRDVAILTLPLEIFASRPGPCKRSLRSFSSTSGTSAVRPNIPNELTPGCCINSRRGPQRKNSPTGSRLNCRI